MSRAVTRLSTSCSLRPCFIISATYSLLYSVPTWGGFDFPSVTTVVRNTLRPYTIGDDHPRPGISAAHSTFSVFDHFSGSVPFGTIGFASGPRNPGQAGSVAHAAPKLSAITPRTTRIAADKECPFRNSTLR